MLDILRRTSLILQASDCLVKYRFQESLDGAQLLSIVDGLIDTGMRMNGILSNARPNSRKSSDMINENLLLIEIGRAFVITLLLRLLVEDSLLKTFFALCGVKPTKNKLE